MDPFLKPLTRGQGQLFKKAFRKFKALSVSTVPLKTKGQASILKNKKSKSSKTLQKLVVLTVCSISAYVGYPFYSSANSLKKLDKNQQKTTLSSFFALKDSRPINALYTADVSNQCLSKSLFPTVARSDTSQSFSENELNEKNDHLKTTPTVSAHSIHPSTTHCQNTALNITKSEAHTSTEYVEKIPHDTFTPMVSKGAVKKSSFSKVPTPSVVLSHNFSQSELHSDSRKQSLKSENTSNRRPTVGSLNKKTLDETLLPVTLEMDSTLNFFLILLKNRVKEKKEKFSNDMKILHKCVRHLKTFTHKLQDQEAYLNRKIQHLTMLDSLQKQWFHQKISVQQVIAHLYKNFPNDSFIFQLLQSLPHIYECNKHKKATFVPLKSLQKKILTIQHDALLSMFLSSRMGLTAHMSGLLKFFVFKQTGCLLPTRFFAQHSNQEEHTRHYQNIHFLNEAIRHASCNNIYESYCNLQKIQGQFPILFKTWLEEIETSLTLLDLFDSVSLYLQSH